MKVHPFNWGIEASGNYFDALRIQPYLGSFFHASDEHGPNSAPYIVLSYAYWHRHFQDDRGLVGRTVQLNNHPFIILGVAPPTFRGTLVFFSSEFFVPIVNQEQVDGSSALNACGGCVEQPVVKAVQCGRQRLGPVVLSEIGTFREWKGKSAF